MKLEWESLLVFGLLILYTYSFTYKFLSSLYLLKFLFYPFVPLLNIIVKFYSIVIFCDKIFISLKGLNHLLNHKYTSYKQLFIEISQKQMFLLFKGKLL